jgi:hypothetical protein
MDTSSLENASSQCNDCSHRVDGKATCKAFPDGIPSRILTGKHDHRKSYPGDNGVKFKKQEAPTMPVADPAKEAWSADDIRSMISAKLNPNGYDTKNYVYITTVYPLDSYVIIEEKGLHYKVDYAISDTGIVTLDLANKKPAKAGWEIEEAASTSVEPEDAWVSTVGIIKEAKGKAGKSSKDDVDEYPVVLLREGDTADGKRSYSKAAIKSFVKVLESRPLKMFINHSTASEDSQRPERNLKDWAATAQEACVATGDDGKLEVRAVAHVHDKWLKESLKDPVFRQEVGISIHAFAKMKPSGQKKVVESFYRARSADFVTQANAGGKVAELLESRREDLEMLETVTLDELRESRPDLVEAIAKAGDTELKPEELQAIVKEATEAAVKPLAEKVDKLESQVAAGSRTPRLVELLEAEKLPKAAQDRVIESLKSKTFESDEAMAAAVKESAEAEREYLKQVAPGATVKEAGGEGDHKTAGSGPSALQGKVAQAMGTI